MALLTCPRETQDFPRSLGKRHRRHYPLVEAEARSRTGEPHAPEEAQPANQQAFTICFACDYRAGEDHTIERPTEYAFWRDYVPALLPQRMENLLPANKNTGKTHITNGAYRLHPVEWNIGEAAGHLAAFCHARKRVPRQVRRQPALLREFQARLQAAGIELAWPRSAKLAPL